MTNENSEILNHNFYLIEALKKIKTHKEGKLLENSRKQVNYSINTYELEGLHQEDVENIVEFAFKQRISSLIYKDLEPHIKSTPTPIGEDFSLDFMVMGTKNFVDIVNFCVKTMSMDAIERIRNNQ